MRQLRLLIIAAFAICAFGAVASAVANAEDGQPAILLLSGNVSELKTEAKGGEGRLETLGGLTIESTAVTATLKGCTELEKKPLDTNSCEALLTFTGWKSGGAGCRSHTLAGVKDAIETVLVKSPLTLAGEKSTGGVLQPLLIFKFLNVDGDNELELTCGVIELRAKGQVGCLLLPGLTNIATTAKYEILCKIKTGSKGDQETGTCEQTKASCEALAKDPLESKIGEKFEDAALQFHVEGSFNKDVFIDD